MTWRSDSRAGRRYGLLLCLGIGLLLPVACSEDDPVEPADTASPTITITYPSAQTVGIGGTWVFTGTTTDDGEVKSLTWMTSTGNSGTVTGNLANWSADVELGYGDVSVTLTAVDGANNQATAEVEVVSNHFLRFTQPAQMSPSAAITGQNTAIQLHAALDPASVGASAERTLTAVELVLDGPGSAVLATLTDDGDLDNGDEIDGDSVYSVRTAHTFADEGAQRLRIRARYLLADNSTLQDFGAAMVVTVIPGVEPQDMLDALDAGAEGWGVADDLIAGGASIAEAAAEAAAQLAGSADIASATTSEDGYVVWYETTAGLRGNIVLNPDGTRGGGKRLQSDRGGPMLSAPYAWQLPGGRDEQVSSNNVIVFDAYNSQFAPFDEGPFLRDLFHHADCPQFEVDYFIDAQCTVDVVETFDQYGTIILVTHGGRQDGEVFFMTRQVATPGSMAQHEVDLLLDNLTLTTMGGMQYFSIMPGFIANLSTLPASVVYNGSCESQANATMADAFLDNGATTYLGFSRVVNSDFAQAVAEDFFGAMVTDGEDSDEAFTAGQVDPGDPHAEFRMSRNDAAFYNADFINGGFEDGALSGWTRAGDGRVIAALGSTLPTEGSFMGIISTGLGYTTDSGSITAAICSVGESTSTLSLSFDWNFFSEEFLEWCGTQYQDFFDVVVVIDGVETLLMHQWIDNLCGSVSPSDVSFDKGGVYDTGWQSASLMVPAVAAGQSLLISFRAGDVGDSIYDSAILIDNVRLE